MKATALELFRKAYPRIAFFSYLNEIRRQLAGCRSCLDIGCGPGSPVQLLRFEHAIGVDGHRPSYEEALRNHTHDELHCAPVQEIGKLFPENAVDCCIGLDLIEHLTKDDGLRLIKDMECIAAKKILLFTPNGFLPQQSHDGDLQEHLSGWSAEEMKDLGFTVYGMHGHKWLRGEQHQHRFKPHALSGLVSEFTHYTWTRLHPRNAAAIFCVKEVGKG